MKTFHDRKRVILMAIAFLVAAPAGAFPPAPHHLIYGMVRDEFGNPISAATAEPHVRLRGGVGTVQEHDER